MRRRLPYALFAIAAVVSLASATVGGQSRAKTEGQPTKAWSQPRTPDGQPDLQGYWTNATFTPLERPAELAGKEFLTEAEAAHYQQQQELRENSQSKDDIHYDNVIWQSESYAKGVSRRRSSLIFEPADGRVPPLTANAQKRAAARAAEARSRALLTPSNTDRSASAASRGETKAHRCWARPTTTTCRSFKATMPW
jgi:hypothetical protein